MIKGEGKILKDMAMVNYLNLILKSNRLKLAQVDLKYADEIVANFSAAIT